MTCNGSSVHDDAAFGRDLMKLRPQLIGYALKLCRNKDDAEDLASGTIAKGWRFRDKFQPGTSLSAWLTFILRNDFLSQMRRKRWDGGSTEDIENLQIPCRGNQEDWVTLKDLEFAFTLIPKEMLQAIMAVVFEGGYDEAAEALNVRVGTVKSRVARGRQKLMELGL